MTISGRLTADPRKPTPFSLPENRLSDGGLKHTNSFPSARKSAEKVDDLWLSNGGPKKKASSFSLPENRPKKRKDLRLSDDGGPKHTNSLSTAGESAIVMDRFMAV